MVYHFTPYATERDLAKAYNDHMKLLPAGSAACIRDLDTMLLTPDAGAIINRAVAQYPDTVFVCWANRIHPAAKDQIYGARISDDADIRNHITIAARVSSTGTYTSVNGPLSGFFMVVPKSVWDRVPFREGNGLLGVDTMFFREVRAAKIAVRRIDGLYIWHSYRIWKNYKDVKHLQ